MTAAELETLLATDDTVTVYGDNILFVDPPPTNHEHTRHEDDHDHGETEAATAADTTFTRLIHGTHVPWNKLHSRPGAPHTLYIDPTGATLTGTIANYLTGKPEVTSPPFSLDNNPRTFNTTEQTIMRTIWEAVADDYAPFNINVTTEPPTTNIPFDGNHVAHVLITPETWYPVPAVGLAFMNTSDSATPAWCVTAYVRDLQNPSTTAKTLAECVAHEAGHMFGLTHDGNGNSEYFYGTDDWAPIMGFGFYSTTTQWSRGAYPNATNTEDDIAVIAERIGYAPTPPVRPTHTHGTRLHQLTNTNRTNTHTIVTNGLTRITVRPVDRGNLIARATITRTNSSTGRTGEADNNRGVAPARASIIVAAAQPSAENTFTVPAGTWTLTVTSAAINAGGERTNYGSIGRYTLRIIPRPQPAHITLRWGRTGTTLHIHGTATSRNTPASGITITTSTTIRDNSTGDSTTRTHTRTTRADGTTHPIRIGNRARLAGHTVRVRITNIDHPNRYLPGRISGPQPRTVTPATHR
jgi:hypothetical protein